AGLERRVERRGVEERKEVVDREGARRPGTHAPHFLGHRRHRHHGEGERAERARLAHGARQLGARDVAHAGLDDRPVETEEVGERRPQHARRIAWTPGRTPGGVPARGGILLFLPPGAPTALGAGRATRRRAAPFGFGPGRPVAGDALEGTRRWSCVQLCSSSAWSRARLPRRPRRRGCSAWTRGRSRRRATTATAPSACASASPRWATVA